MNLGVDDRSSVSSNTKAQQSMQHALNYQAIHATRVGAEYLNEVEETSELNDSMSGGALDRSALNNTDTVHNQSNSIEMVVPMQHRYSMDARARNDVVIINDSPAGNAY